MKLIHFLKCLKQKVLIGYTYDSNVVFRMVVLMYLIEY